MRERKFYTPAGQTTVFAPDARPVSTPSVACGHCGRHYDAGAGGVLRGWCDVCNKPTCGPRCGHADPSVYLDRVARGEDPDYPPMAGPPPALPVTDFGFSIPGGVGIPGLTVSVPAAAPPG